MGNPTLPYHLHTQTGWLRVEVLPSEEKVGEEVTPHDRQEAYLLQNSQRRREYLAWRAMLYRILGPIEIHYAPSGAPQLPEGSGWIGVSHNRTYVALTYSATAPTAVDIESADRNFTAITSRYLTAEELALSTHPDWRCIAWCAKECLYKLGNRRGIDLLRNIRLQQADLDPESGEGNLLGCVNGICYPLQSRKIGPHRLVWHLK